MDDLISRQAAIREVKKHYRAYDNDLLELITFDIERLPPAQPEERTEKRTETLACVLISQQEAVELAMKYCPDDDGSIERDGDIRELLDELENLPPAQPEPKTALWLIRKWGSDAKCSNCGKTFSDVYDMDNHDRFCRFCGRKMIGVKGETK